MSNEQILKKAIEKAVENGWKPEDLDTMAILDLSIPHFIKSTRYYQFIFRNDFAKAFWGEELIHYDKIGKSVPTWITHIIVMVQKEEPLKYIEKFINK